MGATGSPSEGGELPYRVSLKGWRRGEGKAPTYLGTTECSIPYTLLHGLGITSTVRWGGWDSEGWNDWTKAKELVSGEARATILALLFPFHGTQGLSPDKYLCLGQAVGKVHTCSSIHWLSQTVSLPPVGMILRDNSFLTCSYCPATPTARRKVVFLKF